MDQSKKRQGAQPLVLVIDNVRSAYNVGSLWRTADAAGAAEVVICGISPHPGVADDPRLPHVVDKDLRTIAKTALGAEATLPFRYFESTEQALADLKTAGFTIAVVEQDERSQNLFDYSPTGPTALVVGHERTGVADPVLKLADFILEIPMRGQKESLNVAVAGGIALYQILNSKP